MLSSRLVFAPLLGALLIMVSVAVQCAELELQVVKAAPGKIMAGEKVLAEVPAGMPLWIFNKKSGWAEVKVPGGEDHGWITEASLQSVAFSEEQKKLLGTAAPLFQKYMQLAQAEQYPAARAALEQAAKLERQALGDAHPYLAKTLLHLGRVRMQNDDYAGSEQAYNDCLALRIKHLGKLNYYTMEVLCDLGNLHKERGDYIRALDFNKQALELIPKVDGTSADDYAVVYANRASIQQLAGDYASARKAYEDSLLYQRRVPGNQDLHIASTLNNLALLLEELADYPAARAAYDEALALWRKNLGNNHPKVAVGLSNLALLLHKQGNDAEARKNLEQALAIQRLQPAENQRTIMMGLNNLALIMSSQEDHAGARKCLEESLDIGQKLLGPEHPDLGHMYQNLGNALKDLQDFAGARRNYDQSLLIRRKHLGANHPLTAGVQQCLGNLLVEQKNFPEALQYFEQSFDIYQKFYGPEHPQTANAWAALGWAKLGLNKQDEAAANWDRARRITRRHSQHVLPSLSAAEQLDFLEHRYREYWHDSLSFGWKLREDPAIVRLSFNWLINGKAIAQESLAAQQLLVRDASNPQFAASVKNLTAVRQQLATLALSTPEANKVAAHQKQIAELSVREQELTRALRQATGETKNSAAWVELPALAAALPPESVYIDVLRLPLEDFEKPERSPPHYLAWLVPAGDPAKALILDLGEAEPIEAAVEQARSTLAQTAAADGALRKQGESAATKQAGQALQRVADLVLKPLLPHIDGAKLIVLSPDGTLWLVPWAALPAGDGQCLVERTALRYALSGRDIVKSAPASKLSTTAPAIFANPDFDLGGTAAKAALKAVLPHATFAETTRGMASQSTLPRVTPLPFTSLEAAAAQPLLAQISGHKPLAYEQNSALEEVANTLQRPRQLVFATHGFFLPDRGSAAGNSRESRSSGETFGQGENPLVRCGLLLAGCNAEHTPGLDDGILTGMEIVGMDLRGTELVVLSACETGIGKVRNGEGVAGLRQAFQLAGAQSVVSTLWQVPDRDSALIMQDFFANLAGGQSKADALRNAQLKRIAARKEKSGAAHPFFWAAWTVTGE